MDKVLFHWEHCIPARLTGAVLLPPQLQTAALSHSLRPLFLQLCGDGGKHPAERQPYFCWIIFLPYPSHTGVHHMATETCILLPRSGLCAEGQRLWALDAGVAYSASTEQ